MPQSQSSKESYQYPALPTTTSFRVIELLPGQQSEPLSCLLHVTDWSEPIGYEAISYAWGNPNARMPIDCHEKTLEVTRNLHQALEHFRYHDRSRFLWADALCINQSHIPERSHQVRQMRKIYERARAVLVWLGRDTEDHQAKAAVDSISTISDFLCRELDVSLSKSSLGDNILYQEVILRNRDHLPVPNEAMFSVRPRWETLVWFYSHPYFTRSWVIPEVGANKNRMVHCGYETVEWDRVDMVASYLIMDNSFSQLFGFTSTHCWWATSIAELLQQHHNWLFMLYLASNFSCLDARDAIFSLRGLMHMSNPHLLEPDYSKSTTEVYQDSVEAALINFKSTDALLYLTGDENPSWVPRWDRPMLFRNPFRFGKRVPWKLAREKEPVWTIDRRAGILSLSGVVIDVLEFTSTYNQRMFSSATMETNEGRRSLKHTWIRILETVQKSQSHLPFSSTTLDALATSFSFGLNSKGDQPEENQLLHSFVAFLKIVLDGDVFSKYVPSELMVQFDATNGNTFGKPVWDFEYPECSFFVTKEGLIGCSISTTNPGDVVFVPLGGTYPLLLRPVGDHFLIRGYAYVHGIMFGERQSSEVRSVEIH